MKLQVKRIHEPREEGDGVRILVDRLWPRGVSKEKAALDHWAKAVAPSRELREWFGHEPTRWPEFRRRYFAELDENRDEVEALRRCFGPGMNTLLFGTREERFNNAVALRDYLEAADSGEDS